MLVLYLLNLRVPGAKPGATPQEEPTAGNKEEPVSTTKPVQKAEPVQEQPKGKDGEAYEANVKKSSFKPGQSNGGPGTWEIRPTPQKGAAHQEKVTGAPKNTEYVVKTDKMKSGEKKFDGYDSETNTLKDAKDWDKWPPSGNKDWEIAARKSEMNNAKKDAAIAKDAGSTLEYHVPTQEKADQLNELFSINKIDIKVVVTPK